MSTVTTGGGVDVFKVVGLVNESPAEDKIVFGS
jgi:hypothetical protein